MKRRSSENAFHGSEKLGILPQPRPRINTAPR